MAESLNYKLTLDSSPAIQQLKDFGEAAKQVANEVKSAMAEIGKKEVEAKVKVKTAGAEQAKQKFKSIEGTIKALNKDQNFYNNLLKQTPAQVRAINKVLKEKQSRTKMLSSDGKKVTDEWKRTTDQIKQTQAALNQMGQSAGSAFGSGGVSNFLQRLSLVQVAANLGTAAIMSLGRAVVGLVTEGQQLRILQMQLEAFTGSSQTARDTWKTLQVIAAKTTFNTAEIVEANQILLSYGLTTNKAVEATDRLATIASATGGDLNLLARNLGQVGTQGRAYTRDLTQFALQGIPIWNELAAVTGKNTVEVRELAAEGQIGFREVSKALENMTAKGSAFAIIADRMQNTWPALLEQLVSAFQNLSVAIAEAFDLLDSALGGGIKGAFKAFTASVQLLADNFVNLLPAIVSVGAALLVLFSPAILLGIKALIASVWAKVTALWAAVAAQTTLNVATGNFVAVAATVAAGAVAYGAVSNAIKNAKNEQQELTRESLAGATASTEINDRLLNGLVQLKPAVRGLVDEYRELKGVRDENAQAIQGELAMIADGLKAYEDKLKVELDGIEEKKQAIKDQISEEKELNKEVKEQLKERYNKELEDVRQVIAEKTEFYDAEIGKLQELTTAEQAVRDKRKKDLENKARNVQLSVDERNEAQALLDRMIRNEQIAELRKKKAAEINELKKKETKIQDELKAKLEEQENKLKEIMKTKEGQIDQLDQEKARQEALFQGLKQGYLDAKEAVDGSVLSMQDLEGRIRDQLAALAPNTAELNKQNEALDVMIGKLRTAAREAAKIKVSGVPNVPNAKYAGGPVTGGQTYTVNELGQEAFLSSSGKLSQIKAPSWGQWKAPGNGTVIPAHIAAGLDVPSSGLNVSGRTPAGADSSGNTKLLKGMLSALKHGGGNTTNNVTIQATNTSKAASDVLVTLARIKRRRYN